MVLREEVSSLEKPPVSDAKAIMWTCTLSAPEMTVVLYSISGLPLYHVSDIINRLSSCIVLYIYIYVCVSIHIQIYENLKHKNIKYVLKYKKKSAVKGVRRQRPLKDKREIIKDSSKCQF